MPTALIEQGYRFYFYMADLINEPPHVHVDKQGNTAKYWLSPVELANSGGFKSRELRQIERLIDANLDSLLGKWFEEQRKLK